ncbi:putative iron-regulated membrane protein [Pedobacter cryoconitis]|uniref:PepSY-associated TM helix domain-containing protein n=1 Tax=Pedobacter cryoconitis TaxID=188932 RepID=UPI00160C1BD4|nr:PepSY-associated TM helix domain-containing protein [Pedobacter cryoconitis]MBB6273621.1 putative iron-regulated membrane protein [Pedobacter cryoconitis]
MFKKINAWLHLWLGLASGIIVVIVSLTGCILVFEQEINNLLFPYLTVKPEAESKYLPPSEIYNSIAKSLPGKKAVSIWYHGLDKSAHVTINSDSTAYVNPFTGEVLAVADHDAFFHFIDEGHRNLWMGRKIGKAVVGWGTFIFFLLLISGLILWYPKKWSKTNINRSFKIKWNAKFKKLNYDLHNVLGFYSLLIAVILACTGLIMSFSWFSKSIYWLSGGDSMPKRQKQTEVKLIPPPNPIVYSSDKVWYKVRKEMAVHEKNAIIVSIPDHDDEAIYACTDMHNGSWRDLYFNPTTIEPMPYSGKRLSDLAFADWLRKSNYAIHVGAIGGLFTKIIAFITSLICASLPVTGFYVWWGKRKKTNKKQKLTV